MSESFVDLSYRGLALGKRIKLTQVRPTTGYLEIPTPMPVGTTIGIATEEGVLLEAVVTDIHEQVTGSDRAPGMLVKPNLSIESQESWWKGRVDLPAEKVEKSAKAAPVADAQGKVTVTSRRADGAVPELMDDGRNTAVMQIIDDAPVETVIADLPHDTAPSARALPRDAAPSVPAPPPPHDTGVAAVRRKTPARGTSTIPNAPTGMRDTNPEGVPLIDDGKRTIAMDAVDLAALGLRSSSDQLPVVKPEDYVDDEPGGGNSGPVATGDKPDGKTKKKKPKRR